MMSYLPLHQSAMLSVKCLVSSLVILQLIHQTLLVRRAPIWNRLLYAIRRTIAITRSFFVHNTGFFLNLLHI